MKKTFENLKPGDTCYYLSAENNKIEKISVSEIDGLLIIYSTGYSSHGYDGCIKTRYELYSGSDYVYFNLEDAIEELQKRMNLIKKEIEKWKTSGQD